eukprot:scaffold197966_cov14-Prasinocladus_malaysianus.AAC.1
MSGPAGRTDTRAILSLTDHTPIGMGGILSSAHSLRMLAFSIVHIRTASDGRASLYLSGTSI